MSSNTWWYNTKIPRGIFPMGPERSIAPILPLWAKGHSECTKTSDYVSRTTCRRLPDTFSEQTTKLQQDCGDRPEPNPHMSVFTSILCSDFIPPRWFPLTVCTDRCKTGWVQECLPTLCLAELPLVESSIFTHQTEYDLNTWSCAALWAHCAAKITF